jgi:predicted nuclease with RNAse H fold
VLTAGIDLAAQPEKTAACVMEWTASRATVLELLPTADDTQLLDLVGTLRDADKVGIDAPFGWPDAFVRSVSTHRRQGRWSGHRAADQNEYRRALRFRATDEFVRTLGYPAPLSVSSDKIAVPTMRCAHLLDRIAVAGRPVDRAGSGLVVEVYPAVALRRWGLPARNYKRARNVSTLKGLVGTLIRKAPWIDLREHRATCERSDDAFDAVVSALVARAAAKGLTEPMPEASRDLAAREGWIHVPREDSLPALVGGRRGSPRPSA